MQIHTTENIAKDKFIFETLMQPDPEK